MIVPAFFVLDAKTHYYHDLSCFLNIIYIRSLRDKLKPGHRTLTYVIIGELLNLKITIRNVIK